MIRERVMHRAFSLLLRLFPAAFREPFGDAMIADLCDDWKRRTGPFERVRFLLRLLPDLGSTALAEWRRKWRRESRRGGLYAGDLRRARPASRWDALAHDARHAFIQMMRHPVSSAVTVVTLGLGLAIVTAVYALVDGVLLEPLPYPEPERLVRIWTAEDDGAQRFLQATWDEVERFGQLSSFRSVTAFSVAPRDLLDEFGRPTGIDVARVSDEFLETVGVQPVLGRGFDADEATDGAAVVLLDHGFWRSRYGGDESVLGASVAIQGVEHVVVGVLPATFDIPHGVAFWRPFTSEENQDDDRELVALARLADDASLAVAEAELAALFDGGVPLNAALDVEQPGVTAWIQPVRESLVRQVRQPLWMLLAAVAGLLLLTCSNVAHLQLARIASRTKEIAVRLALGAAPHRLFRLLLFENLVFAIVAGGLGLGLGHVLLGAFRRLAPPDFPRLAEVGIDPRVALLVGCVALVSGVLAAWMPARQGAGVDPVRDLKVRASDSGGWKARGLLVTAQVALATVLTVSAGLIFTSIGQQLDVDHGVDLDGVVRISLSPPAGDDDPADRPDFYRGMSEAVKGIPGVVAAGLGNHDALEDDGWWMPFTLPDPEPDRSVVGGTEPRGLTRVVDRAWIEAAGLRFLAGRNFEESLAIRGSTEGSVIVDRAFVRTHLGLADPAEALGRQLSHPAFFEGLPSTHRIVGVVETVRSHAAAEVEPKIYLPYSEFPWPRMHLLVKVEDDAVRALIPRIRARIWSLEPDAPIGSPETFAAAVARRVEHHRFQLRLMASFSYLALFLATVGIYAMLAFHIERRLPELGLRRAFGADGTDIVRRVLGQALRLVLPGLLLGLLGAYFAGKVLAGRLFGVAAVEPAVWSLVAGCILLATLLAALAPLRRALNLQPTKLLQQNS